LDLETQRVWDYASDAYVHRLVRSKTNGKLVEVPAPGMEGGGHRNRLCAETECGVHEPGGSGDMLDPDMEEALVLR